MSPSPARVLLVGACGCISCGAAGCGGGGGVLVSVAVAVAAVAGVVVAGAPPRTVAIPRWGGPSSAGGRGSVLPGATAPPPSRPAILTF